MTRDPHLQSNRFLALYALAFAGGAVAYVPLLTLLLPARVAALAGADAVDWLAYITFAGAISASLAAIGWGWLSDLSGGRRGWVAGGLVASTVMLLLVPRADTLFELLAVLVGWQLALNAMLAPLAAWAGDTVPDPQKGRLGGLLAFAPAAGAAAGALATWPGLAGPDARISIVAGLVAACVLPVLVFGRPRDVTVVAPDAAAATTRQKRARAIRMFLARLLVQLSEAALFAFFYLWFRGFGAGFGDAQAAWLIGAVLITGAPLALFVGHLTDRRSTPIAPLRWAAGVAALGLAAMALAKGPALGIAGYVVFGLAASVFLALHSAQTLRVLPRSDRRGRDLGVFNLTNTVPSLIMPWLTLALVPVFGFAGLFAVLAVLALGALLLLRRGFERAGDRGCDSPAHSL